MDDMSEATTPGLPAAYTDADPSAAATPAADARPGLEPVTVGTGPLTIDEVVRVARDGAPVRIAEQSLTEVRRTREVIRGLADDTEPHYGVSTGFGALATRHIPVEKRHQLQRSLIRSHAAGSGPEVEREVVRALMLLRISTLATGRTGIREETLTTYVAMLNADIAPVVHEYGSLGCSGDLAPLSHCALALMGEGAVRDAHGERMPAADASAAAGIRPVELEEKEGLALINGTDGMLGMLCLAIADLRELLVVADVAAAMSVEGLLGTDDVFAADLHGLRPQPGQAVSAENIRKMMARQRNSPVPPHRCLHPGAGRLLAALRPGRGRWRPRHRRPRRPGGRLGAGVRRRQPRRHARRPGREQRQLPRGSGRLRARLPRDRRGRRRVDLGAPHRPVPRRRPQQRPAAVPRRRPGGRQRPHDRAVHPGGDRVRDEAAGGSGIRRLDPVLGDAGGPRLDGLVRRAQAAARGRRALTRARRRGADSGARARSACPAHARPATAAVVDALVDAGASRPGGDRWLSPEIDTAHRLVTDGTVRRAAESETGPLT